MNQYFDIPGFEELYKITHKGEIKSLSRSIYRLQKGNLTVREKILKQHINDGYLCVQLSKNGKSSLYRVHILLAKTFVPNPMCYPVVRHLNDDRLDNRLLNLAWGTKKQNSEDAKKNGCYKKMPKGTQHYSYGTKMIVDIYTGIFYFGPKEAAEAKGINYATLRNLLTGKGKNKTGLIYV